MMTIKTESAVAVMEVQINALGPISNWSHFSNFIELLSVSSTLISPPATEWCRRAWAPPAVRQWNSNQSNLREHGTPTLSHWWHTRTHTTKQACTCLLSRTRTRMHSESHVQHSLARRHKHRSSGLSALTEHITDSNSSITWNWGGGGNDSNTHFISNIQAGRTTTFS